MICVAARGFAAQVLQPPAMAGFPDERDTPEMFPQKGEAGLLG